MSLLEVHDVDRDFHAPLSHNDLIGRWYGTRAALHGQDPYSPPLSLQIQAIADNDRTTAFDYPAPLVVLLAPLALLPWKSASLVYLLIAIPSLAVAFWFCIRLLQLPLSRNTTLAIVLTSLCSWPLIWGLRLWQPGLLVVVFIFLACFLLHRGHGSAGILLALATIKPQLVLPLLLALLLWTCRRRQWGVLLSFTVTMAILLALAERMIPGWFPEWVSTMRAYQANCGKLPLETILGSIPSRIVALSLIVATGWRMWQIRGCAPRSASFGYAIVLLLSATVAINYTGPLMIYNDVLLLPGCVLLVFGKYTSSSGIRLLPRHFARICLAWTFVSVPLAVVGKFFCASPLLCDKFVFLNPFLGSAITLFLLLNPTLPDDEGQALVHPLAQQPA